VATEVKLPELGEGIESAEVVRVLVSVGETVTAEQALLEIETDKATVEVPAPAAGTVTEIAVTAGTTMAVGATILTLDSASATGGETAPEPTTSAAPAATPEAVPPAASSLAVLAPTPTSTSARPGSVSVGPRRETGRRRALAAPSVRKLAREIGVDIDTVSGTGTGDRVSIDDVKTHARQALTRLATPGAPSTAPALPDFSRWGPVEREPMTRVRRTVARRMSQAWQTVAHVTQHDRADVSEFEAARKTVKLASPDPPSTVTALAVAVVAAALKAFPKFNASLDTERNEVIYKGYINIGGAVDSEQGLLVPVIQAADQKSLGTLSTEIAALADKVRTRKATPQDLEGGTFTITNLGGLGGTSFTPIVNYPEVAILGLSRTAPSPVYVNDRFEARPILPLSLSYDHRLIDGADGVRFLRWIANRLEHPLLLDL
jgi:pyruvate dehydrogenase E2 component (dihydrolipoamide acetyltransferase)